MKKFVVVMLMFVVVSLVNADIVDDRSDEVLSAYVNDPWPDPNSAVDGDKLWGRAGYALACLYTNKDVSKANDYIDWIHDYYNVPTDTSIGFDSYFKMPILWRVYLDPVTNARLTSTSIDDIEDMMWRWVYSRSTIADAQGSVWRIQDSENHDAVQKSSYLLACQALINAGSPYGPNVTLADGHTLQEHYDAWVKYWFEYSRQRVREGLSCEIASPGYAKYTLGCYYNIYDLTDNTGLAYIIEDLLTVYWADAASDFLPATGLRGGAETRAYKDALMYGNDSTKDLLYCYDWHDSVPDSVHPYLLVSIASSYRNPAIVDLIGSDRTKEPYIHKSRRFGLGGNWVNNEYTVLFDTDHASNMSRQTYVDRDYVMGTLSMDTSDGYIALIDQNRLMGVFFAADADDRIAIHGKGTYDSGRTGMTEIYGVCGDKCMIVARDSGAYNSDGTRIFLSDGELGDNLEYDSGWLFTKTGPYGADGRLFVPDDNSSDISRENNLLLGSNTSSFSGTEPSITGANTGYDSTGSALEFDGSDDLAYSSTGWQGHDSVTIDFYFNADVDNVGTQILVNALSTWQVALGYDDVSFTVWTDLSARTLTIADIVATGTWQHVVASIDSNGDMSLTVGASYTSSSGDTLKQQTKDIVLGNKPGTVRWFNGKLDAVKISVPSSSDELAYWQMDSRQCRDVYCGIKIANGSYTSTAVTGGVMLDLSDMWSPIIVQMGVAEDYASYTAFKTSVKANYVNYSSGRVEYFSENYDKYRFWSNSTTLPQINDADVELNPTKTYDGPYLSAYHGNDVVTISHPDATDLTIDMNYHSSPAWDDYQTVALWHMDSSVSGEVIDDDLENSGRNNDLTLTGATITTGNGGYFDEALNFDGVNDYASPGTVWPGAEEFQVDMWIYPTNGDDQNVVVQARNIWFVGIGNGKLSLTTWNSNSTATSLAWATNITYNTWHRVIASCDADGNRRLTLDGVTITDNAGAGLVTSSAVIDMGNKPGYSRYYDGKIDDVKITIPNITAASAPSELTDDGIALGLWHFDTYYTDGGDVYYPDDDSQNSGRDNELHQYSGADAYISQVSGGFDGSGYCLQLDYSATDTYMLLADNWPVTADTFMFQGWVKLGSGDGGYLAHIYDQVWLHCYESTGQITFQVDPDKTDSTDTVSITADISSTTGWQFIEAVYDGDQIILKTEAETVVAAGTGPIVPDRCNVYIGSRKNQNRFVGCLDEIKLSAP